MPLWALQSGVNWDLNAFQILIFFFLYLWGVFSSLYCSFFLSISSYHLPESRLLFSPPKLATFSFPFSLISFFNLAFFPPNLSNFFHSLNLDSSCSFKSLSMWHNSVSLWSRCLVILLTCSYLASRVFFNSSLIVFLSLSAVVLVFSFYFKALHLSFSFFSLSRMLGTD